MCEKFHQLLAIGRWFPPGTPVSSTRKLISSSSFHCLDMTLAVAEALNPNKPKPKMIQHVHRYMTVPVTFVQYICCPTCFVIKRLINWEYEYKLRNSGLFFLKCPTLNRV